MTRNPADEAIACIIRAINVWLAATGSAARVQARDVTITRRNGVFYMAFPERVEGRGKR